MSPTLRFWRSMSWLVVRAGATDTGELVVALDRLGGQVGKRLELRHQRLDRRLAS